MLSLFNLSLAKRSRARAAMTLVELLVVVGLVTILMGLVAASIRPSLENRKSKEASRILVSMFAQAKSRATANGRSVGVWMQGGETIKFDNSASPPVLTADSGDPTFNYCNELYLAEEPLPYSGDLQVSHAVVQQINAGTTARCWIFLPDNSLFAVPGEIQPGDHIKFGYRGHKFPIVAVYDQPQDLTPLGPDNTLKFQAPGFFYEIVFRLEGYFPPNGALATNAGALYAPTPAPMTPYQYNSAEWNGNGPYQLPYQIYRQPRRVGRAVNLPTGTCIDFRSSGFNPVGEDANGNGVLDPGEDVNGNGVLNSINWTAGNATALETHEPIPGVEFGLRPLESGNATALIVFSPDGSVRRVTRNLENADRLRCRDDIVPAQQTLWSDGVSGVPQTAHFLIGTLDKMVVGTPIPYSGGSAEMVGVNENMVSDASLWVTLNMQTGNVTTANNNYRALGNYLSALTAARLFANESQNLGGR